MLTSEHTREQWISAETLERCEADGILEAGRHDCSFAGKLIFKEPGKPSWRPPAWVRRDHLCAYVTCCRAWREASLHIHTQVTRSDCAVRVLDREEKRCLSG